MELSYIWVKNFRNINQQGFNISSRFKFDFEVQTNRLSISPNLKHINNFFGSEITNITGIVGQNGAGKTNLLELTNYVLNEGNTKIDGPFFVVYELSPGMFEVHTHLVQIFNASNGFQISVQDYQSENPYFNVIHFSNIFDGRKHELSKNTIDLSSNRFLINQFGENFLKLFYSDVQSQVKFLESDAFNLLRRIEDSDDRNRNQLFPHRVRLTSPSWGNILHRAKHFDRVVTFSQSTWGSRYSLKQFCLDYRKKITDNQSNNSIIYFTTFLLFIDYLVNILEPQFDNKLIRDMPSPPTALQDRVNSATGVIAGLYDKRIDDIHRILTSRFSEMLTMTIDDPTSRIDFISELAQEYQFSDVIKTNEGKYTNRKLQFSIPFTEGIGRFVNMYIKATSNQSLTFNIEWEGISTGHRAFLSLFARFFSVKDQLTKERIVITMDEGDLYFHPKWQTEFLYNIIRILPQLLDRVSLQLILTTHSPFLVSDLLKSNLIFLRKDNEGQCKVIPSDQIEGETFGGNIGELYLEAFFLKDRFISHFAEEKILALIEIVKNEKIIGLESDDTKKLIDQLGEVLIKNKILQLQSGDTN